MRDKPFLNKYITSAPLYIDKVNEGISVLRKLMSFLSCSLLLTLCKSFARPYFDYGDVISNLFNGKKYWPSEAQSNARQEKNM